MEHSNEFSIEFSKELNALQKLLEAQYKKNQWEGLCQTLLTLSKVGESHGRSDLSMKAQSLREVMGKKAGGREQAGDRIELLYHDLLFQLGHLQWKHSSLGQ